MKRLLSALGIAFVSVLLLGSGPWLPDDMPDFTDFTLPDSNGNQVSTATLRQGKALVVAFGAQWCEYSRHQMDELAKLRQDFDAGDVAIVQILVGEAGQPVAARGQDLPFPVLVDEDGGFARDHGIRGVPLLRVVDSNGKIVWEKNLTPHAWMRDRVKVALLTLDRPLSPGTTVGRAQTRCPVTGDEYDRKVFADRVSDQHRPSGDFTDVAVAHRVYFSTPEARDSFEKHPTKYLDTMAASGETPEKVFFVRDPKSGRKLELCRPCGSIKGSPEFFDFWSKPRASCLRCRRMFDSPGCCKSEVELARLELCPECGHKRGSKDCCSLQGRELCPKCSLPKDSVGCCGIV